MTQLDGNISSVAGENEAKLALRMRKQRPGEDPKHYLNVLRSLWRTAYGGRDETELELKMQFLNGLMDETLSIAGHARWNEHPNCSTDQLLTFVEVVRSYEEYTKLSNCLPEMKMH
eukprot:TRINITY_DN1019_c0_g1_i2.p2 TRINITY_DN1019_c0_g1~~TRINITY_DN1019_c0_g1_i2.p2  ORF type:complete len:116 (+),score=2.51 TRINITY_DN1019_c0_g1_i2:648-995(+)